jgi:hypothetical protein
VKADDRRCVIINLQGGELEEAQGNAEKRIFTVFAFLYHPVLISYYCFDFLYAVREIYLCCSIRFMFLFTVFKCGDEHSI